MSLNDRAAYRKLIVDGTTLEIRDDGVPVQYVGAALLAQPQVGNMTIANDVNIYRFCQRYDREYLMSIYLRMHGLEPSDWVITIYGSDHAFLILANPKKEAEFRRAKEEWPCPDDVRLTEVSTPD